MYDYHCPLEYVVFGVTSLGFDLHLITGVICVITTDRDCSGIYRRTR
jgi:hypothetical protein